MIDVSASRLTAIIIVFVWLGGCARSQLTNYYLLRSIQSPGAEVQAMGPEQGTVIGVGPVKIAEYLDRPQITGR